MKCQSIDPRTPCDLEAQGVVNTHGCQQIHVCIPCLHHYEVVLDQIFGVGVDMQCYVCDHSYDRQNWMTWEPYETS